MEPNQFTREQTASAEKMAMIMDAMVGRLTYDEEFAAALSANARETLARAGMLMEKEGVEVYMASDPDRFDKVCESLFERVDSKFLVDVTAPSCG